MERRASICCWLIWVCLTGQGCHSFVPTQGVVWSPDQAVLARAVVQSDQVTIRNVRNCVYRDSTDYTVHLEDRHYDLQQLQTVDFVICPFSDVPGGAHTFLSFGFDGDRYLAVSAEARRQKGEEYSATEALLPHYPLVYIIGDERDLIGLRTNQWMNDVYIYRAKANPDQVRTLFVDMLQRANALQDKPEFYNLLTNNCTTNLRNHINQMSPGRVPYTSQVLLPAFSDRLAYDLDLLETQVPFETLKINSRVNREAYAFRDAPDFSRRIRR